MTDSTTMYCPMTDSTPCSPKILSNLSPQDSAKIADLHPGLRDVLMREISAGNEIHEISAGWPKPTSILMGLKQTFKAGVDPLPTGIAYNKTNDPHYWLAEFCHEESGQTITCPFPAPS